MRSRVKPIALVVGLALLAGCSSEDPEPEPPVEDLTGTSGDEEPEPQEPEPSDEDDPADVAEEEGETPEDEFAVPDEIDAAYAQLVANELLRIETNVSAEARETTTPGEMIPDELLEQLRSITTPDHFAFLATRLQADADDGFELYPEGVIGDPEVEIDQVIESSSTCLVVGGTLDISESAGIEGDDALIPYFLTLVPGGEEAPNQHNPTPWVLAAVGADDHPDPEVYETECG